MTGTRFASDKRARMLAISQVGALVLLCFLMLLATRETYDRVEFPLGCDPFGYTRQAQLFRDRGLDGFDTRLETPHSRQLIEIAKSSGFPDHQWYQAVAPHCHHYKSTTDKVLIQYPPGTGMLMALFAPETQQRMLNLVCTTATITVFAVLLAFAGNFRALGFVVAGAIVSVGAIGVAGGNDNVAPSIMLSVSAGILLPLVQKEKTPAIVALLLGVLIGFSTTVRITNALIVLLIGLWLFARVVLRRDRRNLIDLGLYCIGALAGMLPMFWANYLNAGFAFATTYSEIDAAAPILNLELIWQGAKFYLSWAAHGQVVIAALVIGLVACLTWPRSGAVIAPAVGLVLSLSYFMTKTVRILYYPFAASAVLVAAVSAKSVIGSGYRSPGRWIYASGFAVFVWVVSTFTYLMHPFAAREIALDPTVRAALAGDPIVWADIYGAPVITHYGVYSAKLNFSSEEVQNALVAGVHRAGIRQFFVADTKSMKGIAERLRSTWRLEEVGEIFGNHQIYEIKVQD